MPFLAQVMQIAHDLPIFERLSANDTIRFTTAAGWLTLAIGIAAGIAVGRLISMAFQRAARRLGERGAQMRSLLASSLANPLSLAIIGIGLSIGIGKLAPSVELDVSARKGLGLLYIVAIGWLLYNLVDLLDATLKNITAKTTHSMDDQLVPLVTKTVRVLLVVMLVLFTAENIFNADIKTWLAGLGIAGLAVSLAAQDSIKNVFGSVTILMDQPFAQGDFVTIGEYTGTVEAVGFRSTRLRTIDGSLVTMPNSKVSDSNICNLQRRKAIRRTFNITITYDTPPQRAQQAIQIIKDVLGEPDIASGLDIASFPTRVFFDNFNSESLNIQVNYWFARVDFWLYQAHAEKVNLRILQRFNEAGIEFAFPTRTLLLASDPKRPLQLTSKDAASA